MKRIALLLSLSFAVLFCSAYLFGQEEQSAGERKIVSRINPIYPAMARNFGLKGAAKVEAVVAPNGSVKTVHIKGGHPLLAQAAADAVTRWKWVASPHETLEVVEVKFDPE